MKTSLPEILITKQYPEEIVKPLKAMAIVHQWDGHAYDLMPRQSVLEIVERLSGIINQAELKVDKELLEKGNNLKIVANVSIGVDNLDLKLMNEYGIWGTNTPGFFDYPVSEFVMGGMINIMHRMSEADAFVRSGQWKSFQPGRWDGENLKGKTLGIIGMGNIGSSVSKLAKAFGMKVVCYSKGDSAISNNCVSLDKLLSEADIISVHVPYNHSTHELINRGLFEKMKPGVIFINTSRGKVVNEKDLVHQLESGHIGGAVLDVFEREPEVPEILKSMPNVLLTPHIAGGIRSGRMTCYKMAVEEVLRILKGKTPLYPVNNPKLKNR